jgi:hypothetical protein
MALAQRQAGVTHGYQEKVKRVQKTEPTLLQLVVKTLLTNARDIREFIADEIVYETLDTLHLLRYIKYQLGFRPRRRGESVNTERTPNFAPPATYPEPVPVMAKR